MSRAILDAPNDLTRRILDRRYAEGDIDQRDILATPDSFIMLDTLTARGTIESHGFLPFRMVRRYQDENRLTHHLVGPRTEQTLCPIVPAGADTVQIFAKQ